MPRRALSCDLVFSTLRELTKEEQVKVEQDKAYEYHATARVTKRSLSDKSRDELEKEIHGFMKLFSPDDMKSPLLADISANSGWKVVFDQYQRVTSRYSVVWVSPLLLFLLCNFQHHLPANQLLSSLNLLRSCYIFVWVFFCTFRARQTANERFCPLSHPPYTDTGRHSRRCFGEQQAEKGSSCRNTVLVMVLV